MSDTKYSVGQIVGTKYGSARVVEFYGKVDVSNAAPVDGSSGFMPRTLPSGQWLVPA